MDLTIGEAARREFFGFARNGTVVKKLRWQEEFRGIWLAVVNGNFTEHIYRDSKGRAIGSRTKLTVGDKELIIRNGPKTEGIIRRPNVDIITYEPYFVRLE